MAMFVLYLLGLYHAIQYLRNRKNEHDWWSVAYKQIGHPVWHPGTYNGSALGQIHMGWLVDQRCKIEYGSFVYVLVFWLSIIEKFIQ